MIHRLIVGTGGILLICSILSTLLVSCKKDSSTTTPQVHNNSIRIVSNAKYGNIITDSAGRTLYFFSNDANGSSSCTGGCLVAWPLFYKASPTIDTGLNVADFQTITRSDNTSQLSYKGWPLYYYQFDSLPGDVKGEGVGGIWFVAKPDYTVMLVRTQLVGNDGVSYDSAYQPGTGKYTYLTDGSGRTLYSFHPDKFKTNTYTKPDFSNDAFWPIDQVSEIKSVPSIIDRSLFDTIHIYGKVQLTFKGWPMYYFGPDNQQRGNTKGVSVPVPGIWPVVNQYSPSAPQ